MCTLCVCIKRVEYCELGSTRVLEYAVSVVNMSFVTTDVRMCYL